MTPAAFILIILSAGFHATWNMIAKKQGASLALYATMALVGTTWSFFVRFFTPLEFFGQPWRFHAWLALMLVSEFTYAIGLKLSYRTLDMSIAYPMMRSVPLLLLAAFTALFGFGRPLGPHALLGMAMVFAGCLAIPLRTFADFRLSRYFDRSFGYILLVALGTTGYTLCDSQAQKHMLEGAAAGGIEIGKPLLSLTYYSFRSATLSTALWIAVLCNRETRAETRELVRSGGLKTAVFGGVCASLTYSLVLVSMNFVSNVAYVQAFRQVGLLFGLAEGVFILKERFTWPKAAGVLLILAGLAVSVL